jgi:hypothetical protein
MKHLIGFFIFLVVTAAGVHAQDAKATSVYTSLSASSCRVVKTGGETGGSTRRCPGVGGYSLLVLDDDERMSVTIVSPDKKEYPLDYWNVVTGAFSTLGAKAEWRVIKEKGKIVPIALIVRVNATIEEDPGKPQKKSILAAAKITPNSACVTEKLIS